MKNVILCVNFSLGKLEFGLGGNHPSFLIFFPLIISKKIVFSPLSSPSHTSYFIPPKMEVLDPPPLFKMTKSERFRVNLTLPIPT